MFTVATIYNAYDISLSCRCLVANMFVETTSSSWQPHSSDAPAPSLAPQSQRELPPPPFFCEQPLHAERECEPIAPRWPWLQARDESLHTPHTVFPSKVRWKYASFARCSSNSRLHLILETIPHFCLPESSTFRVPSAETGPRFYIWLLSHSLTPPRFKLCVSMTDSCSL